MKETLPHRIRFEAFEVDPRTGELRKNGDRLKLPEQSFQILAMLLDHPGELVSRDAIQARLWPNDTVVEFENSINAAVKRLRLALSDSADEPRFVETIPRRGYRWLAPVEIVEQPLAQDTTPRPAVAEDGESSLIGKLVSHYRVLSVLGGGGMGVVYKAEDLKLGRLVALKFLPEELADNETAMRRFEREARTASSLNHPGVCTIYEINHDTGQPFIAMELLEGRTLREEIDAASRLSATLPSPKVLDYAAQILTALEAAHSRAVVHRDIKPANLFVSSEGVVKILDFGLAKSGNGDTGEVRSSPGTAPVPRDPSLSRPGDAMGTAGYMSPEQVRGEQVDTRTDIFSFGSVLYEMATGRRAFVGDSPEGLHAAILNREPVSAQEVNPQVSSKLQSIISRALLKDRDRRYQSAGEMLQDVKGLSAEFGTLRTPDVRPSPATPLFRWWAVAVAVFVVASAASGIWYYLHKRQAARLTQQDTIVLADFANSTGNPIFDDTLKQAATIALRQSPFLNILPDRDVRSTLKMMTKPPGTPLTPDVAREICQRSGSKAFVSGAIGMLGSEYVVGLRAVNCLNGQTLADEKTTAAAQDKVLDALGDAAAKLRADLGESLATVQTFDVPLRQATTSSLEALKQYTLGNKAGKEKGPPAAFPYHLRAVQLDPNFAMAYLNLGVGYSIFNQSERASEYFKQAFDLRDHATEREGMMIAGMYYYGVTGDLESAAKEYRKFTRSYPREVAARGYLSTVYARQGQYDQSVRLGEDLLPLAADNLNHYEGLSRFEMGDQRFDKARELLKMAESKKLDSGSLRVVRYGMAFLDNDSQAMEQELAWFRKPGFEAAGLATESETDAFHGRVRKARQETDSAVDHGLKNDDKEGSALITVHSALREAEFGNSAEARHDVAKALNLAPKTLGVEAEAALALAITGDSAGAESLQQDLEKRFPLDTQVQSIWLPTISAQLALSAHNPAAAVEYLQKSSPIELAYIPSSSGLSCLNAIYVRGEAYLAQANSQNAAAEFQKILDHNGIVWYCSTGALAQLGLARANAMEFSKQQGPPAEAARTRALDAYQAFLELWKDADPDIPILKQAKAEYAKISEN